MKVAHAYSNELVSNATLSNNKKRDVTNDRTRWQLET